MASVFVNASFYRNCFDDFVIQSADGDDTTGNRLPISPRITVLNWGATLTPGREFEATLNVKHVSTVVADNDNTFVIPSHNVVDAAATWKHGPLRVTLSAHNLFNEAALPERGRRDGGPRASAAGAGHVRGARQQRSLQPPHRSAMKQTFIVHRWLGVVLGLRFSFCGFRRASPSTGTIQYRHPLMAGADQSVLEPPTIKVSALDAAKNEIEPTGSIRLMTFDGRPVYWFGGRDTAVVHADTGEEQTEISQESVAHIG